MEEARERGHIEVREVAGAYSGEGCEMRNICEGEANREQYAIIGKSRTVIPGLLHQVTFSCYLEEPKTTLRAMLRRRG